MLIVFIAFIIFLIVGMPIAFAVGISGALFFVQHSNLPATIMVQMPLTQAQNFALLAVPLFIFLGSLIEMTGMARAMIQFLASLLGHVRGGLSYVLIGAMYVVSGISGAKAADMAAVAPVLFPEMRERGADEGDLVALLSATGAQTETVPPSLVLITIGSVTGVSITALFTGGLLPGLVLGVIFTQLGVVPKNLLQKAQASGFINMVVFAAIIPALANISISDLIDLILPLVVVFAVSVLSIFVMMKVLPVWKILGDKSMAFGVGFCQMLGFPSTYLISVEVCNAVAEDEDEKAFLMSRVMPRLVVGGMAAMVSILVAGVMAGML